MSRILLASFLAVAGAGCVSYVPSPLDPARSAADLTGRRLAEKTWTLADLSAEAARHAPAVAVARAQYETARAAVRTAGEMPNPTVTLSPQIVTPYTALIAGTYGVDFDWTLETAGKRSRRLDVARANVHAALARVVDAHWTARAAVRKALLDLYAAEQRGKLLAEALRHQGELLSSIEARIAAGSEARSTNTQARLLDAQLRLQAADAAKNAAVAKAALAESLGLGVSGLAGVRFSFAPFETVPKRAPVYRLAALTHRADVVTALAEYAATEAALRLEVAKQYPDLHLMPGYQLDAGVNKWSVGIGFTLPILNQNGGAIGEAEAKRKEAAAKFDAVQAKALAECDRAAAGVTAGRAKLAVTEEMLAEQGKQIESEQRLLAAGEGDRLALLAAQVERATTLAARLDALVELQAALGALEEAVQTPLAK
ncbi:MAG TPA: TolC family protein [Chthoniobacteraceae bacterium]|nr:TolC family protein [Chthoniobacteraceae bacterium]